MSRLWGERTYPDAPGYVAHSETSKAAADSITEKRLGDLHRRVWAYLRDVGGATDDAVEVALGLLHQTASARRRELQLSGFVKDSGRTELTRSGRSAIVWEATRP